MRTMGIRPGDAVLVIEHRGEQQLVYNALVVGFSTDDKLAGTHGEPAIEACFVATYPGTWYAPSCGMPTGMPTLKVSGVVHASHRDFIEGRAALGYEELSWSQLVTAAVHALRSYQYGNASTELAEEMADECEKALKASAQAQPYLGLRAL